MLVLFWLSHLFVFVVVHNYFLLLLFLLLNYLALLFQPPVCWHLQSQQFFHPSAQQGISADFLSALPNQQAAR
jgi:hypothetical protein